MSDEIDRLDIVVEAEANKANRALSGMEKRLDCVADSLAKVMLLANKGFDMNKFFGTSTGEKKAEQLGKRMADDLIKGFNLDRAGSEVKRQVRNLSNSIANGLYSGGKNKSYISDMDKLGDVIKRNGSVAENVSSDYKELYDTIRAIGKIRISPETAKSLGDDYKDRSGILKSKMSTGTGIELDSIYQELKGRFSDILPDVSNTEDQFYAINDSVREFISLRDQAFRKVNEDEAYEAVARSVEDLNTELRVAKAESDAFNSSLSEMKSLSESFKFDFSGLESAQKTMDSMAKKPKARKAPSVENADFDKTARSIDDLFDKYGKAGFGIDYSDMGFRELQREQAKMQREARRYSAALDEKISVEQPRELGKAYDKLVYKIQRARNATADLGDEIEKRQRLFRELGEALTQSGGKENSEIDSAIEEFKGLGKDFELPTFKTEDDLIKYIDAVEEKFLDLYEVARQADSEVDFSNTIKQLAYLDNILGRSRSYLSSFPDKGESNISIPETSYSVDVNEALDMTFGDGAAEFKKQLDEVGESASSVGSKMNSFKKSLDDQELKTYEAQIRKLKKELFEIASQGFKQGDPEYDEKAKELAVLTAKQKQYNKALRDSANAEVGKSGSASRLKSIGNALSSSTSKVKKFTTTVRSGFKKASGAVSGFLSTLGKLGKGLAYPIEQLGRMRNAVFGLQQQTNKGMSWGRMIGSSVFFSFVFQGISAIQRAIAEGSNNLVQYSNVYNQSISSMVSALTYLKNAWAAAFAPIVNVVAPYIQSFINMIAGALNAIGTFFAALTGKGFVVHAKKVVQNYGASLADVGSSGSDAGKGLDDANKSAKKLQRTVLGFDQLNILNDPNAGSGSGGSGGGNGSGGGGLDLSPSDMFETVKVDGPLADFAKKLREAFLAEDWEGLGEILADGVNTGLQKLYDAINWKNVGPKITYFCNAFTTTFNSLVDNINWDLMGRTVGAGINSIINTLNLLITGIDWKNLGSKFAEGVNGIFYEVEWDNLGQFVGNKFMIIWDILYGTVMNLDYETIGISFANAVNGIFSTVDFGTIGLTLSTGLNGLATILRNFTSTVDWDSIAKNLYTGINNFIHNTDWATLATTLSNFVMNLLGTINIVVQNTDWNAIGVAIGEFLGNIDWAGILLTVGDIIFTAFSGVISGLFDTGTGRVFLAFVAGLTLLKGVFGFVDLSAEILGWITKASNTFGGFGDLIKTGVVPKVSEGIGHITGEGGLFSKIGSVASKVADLAGKAFTGIGDFITTTAAPAIKTGVDFISSTIFPKISSAASTVVAKAGPILTSIGTKIFSPTGLLIAGIAGGVALIVTHWDEIKDAASKVKDWVGEKWNQVKDWTSKKWSEISTSLSKTWDNLKSWASEKFTNIKDSVSKAWEGAKSATSNLWSSAKKTAGNIWESMKSGASNIFGSIGRKVKETWSGTESDTSKAWSNSKRQVDSSINGIDSSVKSKMNSVKSIVSSTMNQVGNIFESKWRSISSTSTSAIGQMQTSVSQKMGNMKNSISSSMNSIISSYRANWKSMVNVTKSEMNSCVSVFRSFPSKVSSAMSSMYTVGKNAANSFKRGLQSVHIPTPHMNISSYSKQSVGDKVISIPRFKVKWYAQGGFPNMGELFIANERGPELVGRMGNRNVVANNNQIISGIAEGVGPAIYNAVLAAMSQSVGGKNGDVHITLEIDGGKLVTKIVKKYNEMKGSDPNFGFVY
uniref:Minor tail protein n=1 Tax=virus sp. ctah610 TaxID=2826807 RepID=A0A8S5R793_9VIRU|nr:MAG TPA: Minor tail protein [virus sp. ctah610]